MTHVTFGVSLSSFVANMCVKQSAIDFAHNYPNAMIIVEESFYVDDCLTGADTGRRNRVTASATESILRS